MATTRAPSGRFTRPLPDRSMSLTPATMLPATTAAEETMMATAETEAAETGQVISRRCRQVATALTLALPTIIVLAWICGLLDVSITLISLGIFGFTGWTIYRMARSALEFGVIHNWVRVSLSLATVGGLVLTALYAPAAWMLAVSAVLAAVVVNLLCARIARI